MNANESSNGQSARPFRVGIVGGAIGGLTMALFLVRSTFSLRRSTVIYILFEIPRKEFDNE